MKRIIIEQRENKSMRKERLVSFLKSHDAQFIQICKNQHDQIWSIGGVEFTVPNRDIDDNELIEIKRDYLHQSPWEIDYNL